MTTKTHSHNFKRIVILAIVIYWQLPAMDPWQLYSKDPAPSIAPGLINPKDFKEWLDVQVPIAMVKALIKSESEEESSSEFVICKICKRTYSTKASLRSHRFRYHSKKPKSRYVDGIRASSLVRTRTGRHPYQCVFDDSDEGTCGKFFTLKPNAITHVVRYHLKSKSRLEALDYILDLK